MTNPATGDRRSTRIAPILFGALGLAVILVYLAAATGLIRHVDRLVLAAVFAIGPVAILGVLRIADRLSSADGSALVTAGRTFLVIAFSLFTLMLIVQQTVRLGTHELVAKAADEATAETLRLAYRVTNQVQLGIDVAFDVFYCLGVVLYSLAMFRHRDFGRVVGAFGVAAAGALLVLNLSTFPEVPAEAGLVDLGPVTGVWWIAVVVLLVRSERRARRARSG